MENMDLSNAEVAVTTQHILDGKEVGTGTEEFSHIAVVGHLHPVVLVLFPVQDVLCGYGNLGIA